jgi:hypothetical protein
MARRIRSVSGSPADYRKLNDTGLNSSTYHKKDGTPVRAILREALRDEVEEAVGENDSPCDVGEGYHGV